MMLHLTYKANTTGDIAACFIRGDSVAEWLQTLSLLNIPLEKLQCFIIPLSRSTRDPAGLFVIIETGTVIQAENILAPYKKLGEKLFIPVHSSVYPVLGPHEIEDVLLWKYQFFHPTIGLVGLEENDQFQFGKFLSVKTDKNTDWSFANPGNPLQSGLKSISLENTTLDEVLETVASEIDKKSLKEIPTSEKNRNSFWSKFLNHVFWYILSIAAGILKGFDYLFSAGPIARAQNIKGNQGITHRVIQWIDQNMADLEKKRNEELNRLLQMFKDDPEKALQYAIPLNSSFANRQSSRQSALLSKRFEKFNYRQPGHQGLVDGWDLSFHYNDLFATYTIAINKEIELKEFKKAAYIYAHLLGDFHNAARVLEEGKFYRDAAAIHKEHFKNILAAAECLERGEIYEEAIPLYAALDQPEKVGDLYAVLEQHEQAEKHFRTSLDRKIVAGDYLDAARIADNKMKDSRNAKMILLQGWENNKQGEQCLNRYFDFLLKDGDVVAEANAIYKKGLDPSRQLPFLNVLSGITRKNKLLNSSLKSIVYPIICERVSAGHYQSLHYLKQFNDSDQLVGQDVNRYISQNQKTISSRQNEVFTLDSQINWRNAILNRNEIIAVGIKNNFVCVARINFYGHAEYQTWEKKVDQQIAFSMMTGSYSSDTIFIYNDGNIQLFSKKLTKNKYFDSPLDIIFPQWLHNLIPIQFMNENHEICKMELRQNIVINIYSNEGNWLRSIESKYPDVHFDLVPKNISTVFAHHSGYYYAFASEILFIISDKGEMTLFKLDSSIFITSTSHGFPVFHLIVGTQKGYLLCKPSNGNLNVQGEFLANNQVAHSIVFLSSDKFALITGNDVALYQISSGNVDHIRDYSSPNNVIAVTPTSRNNFAIIHDSGRIEKHYL